MSVLVFMWFICLSVCLSGCLSIGLSVCLSIHIFAYCNWLYGLNIVQRPKVAKQLMNYQSDCPPVCQRNIFS